MNSFKILVRFGGALSLTVLVGCGINPPQEPVVTPPVVLKCPDVAAPLSPAIVKISEPKVCPKLKVPPKPKEVAKPVIVPPSDLVTIGRLEKVTVEQLKLTFKARIDTGARLPSLNALDIKYFERDGKHWVRFALLNPTSKQKQVFELPLKRTKVIKQLGGEKQKRPVVSLTLTLGSFTDQVDVNLSDRTGYNYQLLIGRDFIIDRFLVDVGKAFMIDHQK